MWAAAGILGLVVVVTGWLPWTDARDVALTRGGPIMVFLVAITVLAALSDRAGVFDAAAPPGARAPPRDASSRPTSSGTVSRCAMPRATRPAPSRSTQRRPVRLLSIFIG